MATVRYQAIVHWLFSMLKVGSPIYQEAQAWVEESYRESQARTCSCPVCKTERTIVMEAIDDEEIEPLLNGDPWTQVVTMMTVERFIKSVSPPSNDAVALVAACQEEGTSIARENNLRDAYTSLGMPEIRQLLGLLQNRGKTDKPLLAAAGEEKAIDSDGTPIMNEMASDGDALAENDPQGDNSEMTTDKNNSKTALLDNPVSSQMVGTAFFKDGARVEPPPGMTYREMLVQITKQAEEEEQRVAVSERVDAFVLEGAYAFQSALKEKFGWVGLRPIPPKSFFDSGEEPRTIPVPISLTETVPVIWGRVVIPGIKGFLETGFEYKEGRFYFSVSGEVQQKFMPQIRELMELTRRHVKEFSIYKGQALRLELPPPNDRARFSPQNAPVFMDLSAVNPDELIFSDDIGRAIRTNLFNPIEKTELCRRLGIGLKRGALLAGAPGTGKTQTAAVIAKKCVENGWTCFYVKKVDDIADMYRLAASYAPAVLIAEDIDRIGLGEERTAELNELINTLDGVDTKGAEVMVLFTTNKQAREMNSALKRTGRLDLILDMTPPDAEAASKLIRLYSRGRLVDGISLDKVSGMLAGQIPATVKEVCSRALLSAVGHMDAADDLQVITAADLETSAYTMLEQIRLSTSENAEYEPEPGQEMAAAILGKSIGKSLDRLTDAVGMLTSKPETNGASKNGNGRKDAPRATAT